MPGIPLDRVFSRLDGYFDRNDLKGAIKHLNYWRDEALAESDLHGAFLMENELMGAYRMAGERLPAFEMARIGLEHMHELHRENSVSGATCYINAATVYKSFGENERALELYRDALKIYKTELEASDPRIANLYNNMALALADTGSFGEAEKYFASAIEILDGNEGNELEAAISCINDAETKEKEMGFEAAEAYILDRMEQAREYFEDPHVKRDGHYAFVAEKCVSAFRYYGMFMFAKELEERIAGIYGENR